MNDDYTIHIQCVNGRYEAWAGRGKDRKPFMSQGEIKRFMDWEAKRMDALFRKDEELFEREVADGTYAKKLAMREASEALRDKIDAADYKLSELAWRKIAHHFGATLKARQNSAMRGTYLVNMRSFLRGKTMVYIGTCKGREDKYVFTIPAPKIALMKLQAKRYRGCWAYVGWNPVD